MSKENKEVPAQEAASPKSAPTSDNERYLAYFFLLLVLGFVVYVRVRLLGLPLERDEGEYAYAGQLILDGVPPYKEAWNMKLPGTYYMYASFMALFGKNITGIHIGLLLTNLASIALLFLVGKKLLSPFAGAVAGASYAMLSIVPGTYGLAAHATHFIVLFGLGGLLVLLHALENQRLRWFGASGLLFGFAFLMKQHAIFFMLFGGIVILVEAYRASATFRNRAAAKRLAVFAGASIIPYFMVVLSTLLAGTFDHFWHWTVKYAGEYVSIRNWADTARHFLTSVDFVTDGARWLWLTGLGGLGALFFTPISQRNRLILWLFIFCSFLCLLPGLYFRNHYFIVFLPALSLLIGITVHWLSQRAAKFESPYIGFVPVLLFGGMLLWSIYAHRDIYFKKSNAEVCAWLYGRNPFAESLEVAKFIRDNSTASDRIAVIGSEPQIYFYSQRKSVTGYIYTYALMENQPYSLTMQQEMIGEIERQRPKFLIFVDSPFSWLATATSNQFILTWFDNYSTAHYNLVGFADMIAPGKTQYVWREALQYYRVQGQASVSVFERKQ